MGAINLVDTCEETPLDVPKTGTYITIPAWNDVIHLTAPPTYPPDIWNLINQVGALSKVYNQDPLQVSQALNISVGEAADYISKYNDLQEYKRRRYEDALGMIQSPSPHLAQDFGIIMTAIDDVQDFATTVGVISRILGRVFKPAELLAIGAFTVGEFLNRLNLMRGMLGPEKAVICRLVRELKHSSGKSTIKADVHARMKRLFPSQGEALEILQTTDQFFGVGISFGPLVGLIEDAFFGVLQGAPVRFKEWTISDAEAKVILDWQYREFGDAPQIKDTFDFLYKYAESAANVVIAGDYLQFNEFMSGLVTSIESGVKMRCSKVKEAVIDIWEILIGKEATTKKKTSTETRLLIQSLGGDPYSVGSWPVDGLGKFAGINEVMNAYSAQANRVLKFWRSKLGVSDEGLFLDACVKEIGTHAAAMFLDSGGQITESLRPDLLVYLHAMEAGLEPPIGTSEEKLLEWYDYILGRLVYFDISVPPLEILEVAFRKFFSF